MVVMCRSHLIEQHFKNSDTSTRWWTKQDIMFWLHSALSKAPHLIATTFRQRVEMSTELAALFNQVSAQANAISEDEASADSYT